MIQPQQYYTLPALVQLPKPVGDWVLAETVLIIVFGSINVDILFAVGALPRPGETVLGDNYVLSPGGKGANQALAAARSSAAVAMFGCVGRDEFAATALSLLAAGGVDLGGVKATNLPTALTTIGVDPRGENQIIVASGANRQARAVLVPDSVLGSATTVLMQLEAPIDEIARLARRARAQGARVVLNAAPATALPNDLLGDVDVLVVNEIEAAMLAKSAGIAAHDPRPAARYLAERIARPVIVTLGAEGAVAYGAGPDIRVGALPVEPRDTTGAGDAFVGAFAAALDRGGDLEEAMRHGAVAGALACRAVGAQTMLPDRAEIEARLPDLVRTL